MPSSVVQEWGVVAGDETRDGSRGHKVGLVGGPRGRGRILL